jgi:hypothetical protein
LIPKAIRTTGCSWIIALQLKRGDQNQPSEIWMAAGPAGDEPKTQVLSLKDSGEINHPQWTTHVFDILRRQIP